jgi:hypothetical protein
MPAGISVRNPDSVFGGRRIVELESEMLKRGMFFDVIDWSEDQAALPFEA